MIKATPFHRRAADLNPSNAWAGRKGFTLSRFYSGTEEEALAARASAVLCDISFHAFVNVWGGEAADFLTRLATQNISQLIIGQAVRASWLDDDGNFRGKGTIARIGRENFIIQADSGLDWIESASAPFRISAERVEAGLALIGPASADILAAAGLSAPAEWRAGIAVWHGLDLTLLKAGLGTQIWCKSGDAETLWDILIQQGQNFGLVPAGLAALDLLEMETTSSDTGLVDETHTGFNGRAGFLKAQAKQTKIVIGIDIDSDTPAPHVQLFQKGALAGRVLSSLYSPALRRAIALAEVDKKAAVPGTEFTLSLPPDAHHPEPRRVTARAVSLPFLSL